MTRRAVTVILTVLVAVIAFAATVLLYQRNERQRAAEQATAQFDFMVRAHSPVIGPVNAPVTIVEFFDPACEACRAFHPYIKEILAEFPREVRLVIRYVPFHRDPSVTGVQVLEAARRQERFEPVMDALLDSQPAWANRNNPDPDRAWRTAQAAGLDLARARAYVATGAVEKLLAQDMADLKAVGVRATPTFFVNGKLLPLLDPRMLQGMVRYEAGRLRKSR